MISQFRVQASASSDASPLNATGRETQHVTKARFSFPG
jgi:hypothetical protein